MKGFVMKSWKKSLGAHAFILATLLLTNSPSAQASAADKILTKGQPAPFSGVLVREPDYRHDQEELEMYEVLKDFKPCPEYEDPCSEGDFVDGVTDALLWMVVGGAIAAAATH